MPHCSGFRPKRWKACLLVGPLSCRNSPSQFNIGGARITTMLTLCHVIHNLYWILLQQSPGLTETTFVKANKGTIAEIRTRLQTSSSCPTPSVWSCPPLSRYRQLCTQLSVVDSIVSRTYSPGQSSVSVNVPLVAVSLQRDFLRQSHDSPLAGHLGADKSASHLRQMGYWVGMLQDVERYCHRV